MRHSFEHAFSFVERTNKLVKTYEKLYKDYRKIEDNSCPSLESLLVAIFWKNMNTRVMYRNLNTIFPIK